jgi:hypothetical protein
MANGFGFFLGGDNNIWQLINIRLVSVGGIVSVDVGVGNLLETAEPLNKEARVV